MTAKEIIDFLSGFPPQSEVFLCVDRGPYNLCGPFQETWAAEAGEDKLGGQDTDVPPGSPVLW